MVEKGPEFTGPLVNSCPARLLTLEIARFSLISRDSKKCRNHYFCSIISFAFTRPLKMDPQKRGSKNKSVDRTVSKKKTGPLVNSWLWRHQKNRGKIAFSVFCVLDFWPIFVLFCSWFSFFPEVYPPNFCPLYRVAKKTGENKGFCGVVFLSLQKKCYIFCFLYDMCCPYARLPLAVPSSLQMWDMYLFSYLFLLFSFCFPAFFLGGGGVIHLFTLVTSMVLYQWPRNKVKPQETPISEILFLTFCLVACTLTLWPGPHKKRNPKPPSPENRSGLLYNALNHVLKRLFLQCFFEHQPNLPSKSAVQKTLTLHDAQNKTWCFRNGLLWKMKTVVLTKTHNWKKQKTKI